MKSPDHWLYEYSVIRYVPRVDRGEILNIGLLMLCKRQKWLKGMIWIDENRIKSFHPQADIATLKKQTALFEKTDQPFRDIAAEEKYRWLSATKSAIIQTSPSHPGILITDDLENNNDKELLEREFDRLMRELVL